ncbi:MAG: PilZ domain-containing protein, partial [Thermodesulfobacteriota bacterium]
MTLERRRHTRIDSINLLNFSCFDDQDRLVEQGMGRTLNVSVSGILLETTAKLDLNGVVYVTIAFDEDLFSVKGKVVRQKETGENIYEMGIEFLDLDEGQRRYLLEYIKMFDAST